jgi:hypothetical protein
MAAELKKLRAESDCYVRPLRSTAIAFVQSNRRDLRYCFGERWAQDRIAECYVVVLPLTRPIIWRGYAWNVAPAVWTSGWLGQEVAGRAWLISDAGGFESRLNLDGVERAVLQGTGTIYQ